MFYKFASNTKSENKNLIKLHLVFLAKGVDIDAVGVLRVEHEIPGTRESLLTLATAETDSLPAAAARWWFTT